MVTSLEVLKPLPFNASLWVVEMVLIVMIVEVGLIDWFDFGPNDLPVKYYLHSLVFLSAPLVGWRGFMNSQWVVMNNSWPDSFSSIRAAPVCLSLSCLILKGCNMSCHWDHGPNSMANNVIDTRIIDVINIWWFMIMLSRLHYFVFVCLDQHSEAENSPNVATDCPCRN